MIYIIYKIKLIYYQLKLHKIELMFNDQVLYNSNRMNKLLKLYT